MTDLMQKALEAILKWPVERQDDAAGILLAMDRLGSGSYRASAEELMAIDEALADLKKGHFASDADVDAAYARFGK